MSLPARGAWIEMEMPVCRAAVSASLPARGAWIEISVLMCSASLSSGRSPHGERGLKCFEMVQ